jgi:hypothetical protein
MAIAELIEEEALKFCVPVRVEKNYMEIDKEEIERIKKDKELLIDLGLDEWLDEGLI